MRLQGSIKAGTLGALAAGLLMAGCGGSNDSSGQTVGQLPTVTAPALPTQSQPAKSAGTQTVTKAETTPAAPAVPSPSSGGSGEASRRGGTKPVKQTKAERRKQKACEKQVARLPSDQQREALAKCLNPTPPAPPVPETSVNR